MKKKKTPVIRTHKRYRNRKRKAFLSSSPNMISHEPNKKRYEEEKEKEEEGLKVTTPTKHYQTIQEIIDISSDEDDEDMNLQLALFHSVACTHDKTPQIVDVDVKQKGILQQSFTLTPIRHPFRVFNQPGESSVVECVICKDTTSSGLVLLANNYCRHPFCRHCIEIYVSEKLQENIHEVKCPEEKCQQVLDERLLQLLVPDRLCWLRDEAIIEASVLAIPVIIACPFEDCSGLFVDDEKNSLIRACPNCWKIYCFKCWVPWHMGITCIEFQRLEKEKRWFKSLIREALQALSPLVISKSG